MNAALWKDERKPLQNHDVQGVRLLPRTHWPGICFHLRMLQRRIALADSDNDRVTAPSANFIRAIMSTRRGVLQDRNTADLYGETFGLVRSKLTILDSGSEHIEGGHDWGNVNLQRRRTVRLSIPSRRGVPNIETENLLVGMQEKTRTANERHRLFSSHWDSFYTPARI
ncbi:hypothetical protein B0H16DRAFT_1477822 [Mycena metata]|uniref:Uncharacterized protein n=1 Tax=Mycena metata TaxID=1033252 RepID=A0AAD7H8V2_9AGAR|nr:hypothetical protein B0H16DRAFT_1477822 [Mycena metata]